MGFGVRGVDLMRLDRALAFGARGVSGACGARLIESIKSIKLIKPINFGARILAFALVFGFGISSAESKAHADFGAESSAIESTSTANANTDATASTAKSPSFWSRLYQPINITKRSYGAFSIGYSQNTITTPKISLAAPNTQDAQDLQTRITQDFSRVARGAFFGLERGWHTHGFMIGGYLNGVAAQDYLLNFGVRFSYLIARYVIPSVGVSYMLQHLKLPNDDAQYNLQGASFNAGLFVNVVRGFGLKFEGMYAYPLAILREGNARLHGNPTFSGYSFVVSFSFYDFSI
ncbi:MULTISPECIES: hypothetical protein [unclassified Helicobacter]|uniref:hypothetical protein n=1 Tax=unclassified Helicobacter TaxID=2593540 RepID=UPI00115FB283|nr:MULTISPECIES: hypothetical protein [unclassified Helicobacter]